MSARISWISMTPVKGLALELPDEVELLEDGVRGDRRFFLIDERNKLTNNMGRRSPLELVHADFDEATNELTLRLVGGRVLTGAAEQTDEVTVNFHREARSACLVPGQWDRK